MKSTIELELVPVFTRRFNFCILPSSQQIKQSKTQLCTYALLEINSISFAERKAQYALEPQKSKRRGF